MADRGDTHYHVPNLNLWFAFSSIALLISAVWMVLFDFQRPWKEYQRDFREIEIQRGRDALSTPEAEAVFADEARIAEQIESSRTQLTAKGGALETAEQELFVLNDLRVKADAAARVAKQEASWERFLTEEYGLHHPDDVEEYDEKKKNLQALEVAMAESASVLKTAEWEVETKTAEIQSLRTEIDALEAEMKAAGESIELVRKKMAKIDPEDLPTRLANIVRDDIPGLDFVGPALQVKKVLPPDLTFELNFTRKGRIDMCQTCHVPIDRAGFDDEEQPFQSHPRLDLFLSSKSPHPMNEMGCTICHRGAGEALVFQRVDHRANDEAQAKEWEEEYHWHKQHYWDYPMLSADYVEAGCIQCHKDTMEVIAPEAPKLAEGYQLFERYGCYACHKVEWFPTKRRPGPTLAKIKQKTTAEFIGAWVNDPKAFRPTTWMPKIFHLENFAPDVKVADSNYGNGRAMMGDEWSDAALRSVATYILNRSAEEALPAVPVQGDALRGKEVFKLSGCLACHNTVGYTNAERADAVEARDLASVPRDTNEHGPNLRGVATKTTPEWLFTWIKDPKGYWPETRMPDLRLSDQDAADIVAYVFDDPAGTFHQVPEGWETGERPYKRDVLEEQARWFWNRKRPSELEDSFKNEWADDNALLDAVGEKWILAQGCHSCHEIPGLEDAQPIGTELTTWASKTVDKLDFGFIPELLAHDQGFEVGGNEHAHFVEEFKSYRENFLEQKLHAPRAFDRTKIKNPSERLKMPWFDFTEDEVEAISVFVAGLVEDEVQHAKMVPTAEKLSMDTGLRVIRQKNCVACHVIEPGTIEFTDDEGVHREVRGQLSILDDEFSPPPMEMDGPGGLRDHLAEYIAYMREEDDEYELEELYAQLLETVVGMGAVGTTFSISDVDSVKTTPAWGGDFVDLVMRYYLVTWGYADDDDEEGFSVTGDPGGEGRIQDVDGEWRDFAEEQYEKLRWTYAPPVLIDEGSKLQRDWFYNFLIDPVTLRPQIRVKMPTFNWAEGEAGAVADYFASRAKADWPKEYARQLQMQLGVTPAEIAAEMARMRLSGSSGAQVQGISDGLPVETKAGMPNLLAYGTAQGFHIDAAVNPSYEPILPRTPSVIESFQAERPDFYNVVHELTTGAAGPSCIQCHFLEGAPPTNEAPIGWAPDLSHVRDRLRPDWVRRLLVDPSKVYPGTTMPANFAADLTQWQELYAAPSSEQIEAVLTWLFNLDRALLRN